MTNGAQKSAKYNHIKDSGHTCNVECHNVLILNREEQWHKWGITQIQEAISERIEQFLLNKQGDCLSPYHTPGAGHLTVFLVASYVTSPKGQLPDKVPWRDLVAMLQFGIKG